MSSELNQICPACKSKFQIIYYQRRAADEPPDKVVYCPNCPVDTSKLSLEPSTDITRNGITNDIQIIRRPKAIRQSSLSNIGFSYRGNRECIVIQGNAAERCYNQAVAANVSSEPIVATKISIQKSTSKQLVDLYLTSVTGGEAHITEDSKKIAPFICLNKYLLYTSTMDMISTNDKAVVGYEYILDTIPGTVNTVLRTLYKGQRPVIAVFLQDTGSMSNRQFEKYILSILEKVLVKYGTEASVKSFMIPSIVNTLYIQSGKAYDWPSAPNEGYTYAWKPDGERFWYVKYGSIWLFSRRLLSGRITGWNIGTKLEYSTNAGPVLDVEVMIGHDPILIDVLISDSGIATSASRSLDSILTEFDNSNKIDVPIHIRDYFRSEKELLKTKDDISYPIDGVVGIQDGSMTIIKLKDEKSIELELQDNGDLLTSDRILIAESELQHTYTPGSIIEIRFTKQAASDTPMITETLLRTDKTKANESQVCRDIFNTISDTPSSIARRRALLWCNSIRQKLNQIASKTTGKGRVILDIGAGDGQSVSDYSTDPDVTYILLEPDLQKCKKMMRRLAEPGKGECRLFEGASIILHVAGLVSTKKLKYAVINASLKDVLSQQHAIKTLQSCVRYCIASFSISYIVPELRELALNNINVIGCGYMYDSADEHGILINEYGVVMKYANKSMENDNNEATVMWGTDKIYSEKAIVQHDFKDLFYLRLATTKLPIAESKEHSLLNTISSKVFIISTTKHI